MGLLNRASFVIRSKLSSFIDSVSDPRQELDYTYEQLQNQVSQIESRITEYVTEKKKLEAERDGLENDIEKLNELARNAMERGDEEKSEQVLIDKKKKMEEKQQLDARIKDMNQKQKELQKQKKDLQKRVNEFESEKERLKVEYTAADIEEEVTAIETGNANISPDSTVDDIESKITEKQARTDAMDELDTSDTTETLEEDISNMNREYEVQNELEMLREEVQTEKD